MSDLSEKCQVALQLTRDISFKGKNQLFNNLITFLDLGGCKNVVNSNFAQKLNLPIIEDDSAAAKELQQIGKWTGFCIYTLYGNPMQLQRI